MVGLMTDERGVRKNIFNWKRNNKKRTLQPSVSRGVCVGQKHTLDNLRHLECLFMPKTGCSFNIDDGIMYLDKGFVICSFEGF